MRKTTANKSIALRRNKIFQSFKIPVVTGLKQAFKGITQKFKKGKSRKLLCCGIVFHTSDFEYQKYKPGTHIVKRSFA